MKLAHSRFYSVVLIESNCKYLEISRHLGIGAWNLHQKMYSFGHAFPINLWLQHKYILPPYRLEKKCSDFKWSKRSIQISNGRKNRPTWSDSYIQHIYRRLGICVIFQNAENVRLYELFYFLLPIFTINRKSAVTFL